MSRPIGWLPPWLFWRTAYLVFYCGTTLMEHVRLSAVCGWGPKREIHLVPWREIAGRIACGGELAAFEVAKMANVMRRPILPCAREWGFARGRQHAVFGNPRWLWHAIDHLSLS